jgi:hypothetical protein
LSYELFETLRSGDSAKIYTAWRNAGLFDLAYPGVARRLGDDQQVLAEIDRAVAKDVQLPDATLIGAFFLHDMYREFADLTRDGRKLDNVEMLRRLAEMIEPAAANLRLANHTVHLLLQGLFTLTKMNRAPEQGRQVLKLTRHESFGVAVDLQTIAAAAGLVPRDVQGGWRQATRRLKKGQTEGSGDAKPTRRRRRPRRRRRR